MKLLIKILNKEKRIIKSDIKFYLRKILMKKKKMIMMKMMMQLKLLQIKDL